MRKAIFSHCKHIPSLHYKVYRIFALQGIFLLFHSTFFSPCNQCPVTAHKFTSICWYCYSTGRSQRNYQYQRPQWDEVKILNLQWQCTRKGTVYWCKIPYIPWAVEQSLCKIKLVRFSKVKNRMPFSRVTISLTPNCVQLLSSAEKTHPRFQSMAC